MKGLIGLIVAFMIVLMELARSQGLLPAARS